MATLRAQSRPGMCLQEAAKRTGPRTSTSAMNRSTHPPRPLASGRQRRNERCILSPDHWSEMRVDVTELPLLNRMAYDRVAQQYETRAVSDAINDVPIVAAVMSAWRSRHEGTPRLLDVGCGAGVNLRMFANEGCVVTGIDISPEMVTIAQENAPAAQVLEGDVMEIERRESFDIVFAKAFLHLYPKVDAFNVLNHLTSFLVNDGIIYIATTAHQTPSEGFENKSDYEGSPARFRSRWTPGEWHELAKQAGLSIVCEWRNTDRRNNKNWMNLICTRD